MIIAAKDRDEHRPIGHRTTTPNSRVWFGQIFSP